MLVLTRGLKQSVEIGIQTVTITILDVKRGRVRIGIEAPDNVIIRRSELIEADSNPAVTLRAQ